MLAQVLLDAMAETPSPNHANASCLDANFDGYFAVVSAARSTELFESHTHEDSRAQLGSGSDYTAFIDRAGVSSANFGWGAPFIHSRARICFRCL